MEHQILKTEATEDPLYDTEAMQRIMTLAAEIQRKRADLMTADDLVQLGSELGLDPEAVRKAMAVYRQEKTAGRAAREETPARPVKRPWLLGFLLSTAGGVLGGLTMNPWDSAFMIFPFLGIVLSGKCARHPVGGALFGFWTACLTVVFSSSRHYPFHGHELPAFFILASIFGSLIGLVAEWSSHRRGRLLRRLRSRFHPGQEDPGR
ncbi:MAG: hypothetical protein IT210_17970 [Armatimonadetes bacterium]|nr:hypothetical protein [Armatimonadota bacterium]